MCQVNDLEQQIQTQQSEFALERDLVRQEAETRLQRQLEAREKLHQEEVAGLAKEWHTERQVCTVEPG